FSARNGAHAGSAPLLLQAVLPPLAVAIGSSDVIVHGLTHGAHGPSATYIQTVFVPTVRKFGIRLEAATPRWGWAPDGVGELRARIEAPDRLHGASLNERGEMLQIGGSAVASGLDTGYAERQQHRVNRRLQEVGRNASVKVVEMASDTPGGMVFLLAV